LSYAAAGVFGGEAGFSGTPATGAPTTLADGITKGLDNITSPFRKAADFVRGGPEAAANVPAPGVSPVGDATTIAQRLPGAGEGIPILSDGVTSRVLDPQGFGTTDIPFPDTSRVVPMDASVTRGMTTPQVNAVNPQVDTQFARAVAETPVDQSVFTRSLAEPPG
jgi:hypothetical protein